MDEELIIEEMGQPIKKETSKSAVMATVVIIALIIISTSLSIYSMLQVNKAKQALKAYEKKTDSRLSGLDSMNDNFLAELGGKPAALSSNSLNSYAVASCSLGSFPIILENVEPYLDGYRLKIKIANLTSADISNYKIYVKNRASTGPKGNFRWVNDAIWDKGVKEFTQSDRINSGTWGHTSLVIQPAKAKDLQIIKIWIEPNTIYLNN